MLLPYLPRVQNYPYLPQCIANACLDQGMRWQTIRALLDMPWALGMVGRNPYAISNNQMQGLIFKYAQCSSVSSTGSINCPVDERLLKQVLDRLSNL